MNYLVIIVFQCLRDVGLDAQWSSRQRDFQNAHSKELVVSSSSPETIVEIESEDTVKGYLSNMVELLSTSSVASVTCWNGKVLDTLGRIKYIIKIYFNCVFFFCFFNVSTRKLQMWLTFFFLLGNMFIISVFAYLFILRKSSVAKKNVLKLLCQTVKEVGRKNSSSYSWALYSS